MTRSSRWIFRKSSQPAVKDIIINNNISDGRLGGIYHHWYISINPTIRNPGTIYWVHWCSQEVGVWGKQSSTPRLGDGLLNMLKG